MTERLLIWSDEYDQAPVGTCVTWRIGCDVFFERIESVEEDLHATYQSWVRKDQVWTKQTRKRTHEITGVPRYVIQNPTKPVDFIQVDFLEALSKEMP